MVDLLLGNNDASIQEMAEAAELVPTTGCPFARISILTIRSRIAAQILRNLPTARALLDEAVALGRTQPDRWLLAMPLMATGMVAHLQGDHAAARKALVESMDVHRE